MNIVTLLRDILDLYRIPPFRVASLRKRGLKLGANVFIDSSVVIDGVFPYLITIADECTISAGTVILAHDASTKSDLNYSKVGKVYIGKRTFIGANSTILPNVRIGSNVIVGAGSVVANSLPSGVVVAGCPAKIIGTTEEYLKKHEKLLQSRLVDRADRGKVIAATDQIGLIYTL
jgi:maltose O-acetyltransferase